jgi:acetyl-CoA acetyltransferase
LSPKIRNYSGVAVIAPVTVPYERTSARGADWFIGSALRKLIVEAGVQKQAIDGLSISSFTLAPDSPISLVENLGLRLRWLEQVSVGGASGVVALRKAARAIQSGDAEIVACIGGDTANPQSFARLVSNFSQFSNAAVYPYGAAGPNAPFSLITQHYMDMHGATRADFGQIAVSQRYNANHYPGALFSNKTLSINEYLDARKIAGPLHLYDCVMPCAGADGYLVTSVERAKALGLPFAELLAADERYNSFSEDAIQVKGGWCEFKDDLYDRAGIGPEAIDCLQTYDDYPVIVMHQLEGLGFCPFGEAARWVNSTALTFDGGGLPHNTNGGQLSVGQAGCGFLGVVETLRQILQRSGANQVANAETGLVSGYGMVNYDRGLCSTAAILKRCA